MKTIQSFNDFTCWLVWNERMLAHWTQVSDRCPLGYLFSLHSGCNLVFWGLTLRVHPTFCSLKFKVHPSFWRLKTWMLPTYCSLTLRMHSSFRSLKFRVYPGFCRLIYRVHHWFCGLTFRMHPVFSFIILRVHPWFCCLNMQGASRIEYTMNMYSDTWLDPPLFISNSLQICWRKFYRIVTWAVLYRIYAFSQKSWIRLVVMTTKRINWQKKKNAYLRFYSCLLR